jgi:hypothetical protein
MWHLNDADMPFVRMIKDTTGTSPQKKRIGYKPVGYSGQAALRREKCDMITERGNCS